MNNAKPLNRKMSCTTEIIHSTGLFFDRSTSVMTDTTDISVRGWVFFDSSCAICTRSMKRVACLLRRRGLRITPLQSTWARRKLRAAGVDPTLQLHEMRLLLRDGTLAGGGDALIFLAGQYWWAWPLYAVGTYVPFVRALVRKLYRCIADTRHCSAGACALPQSGRAMG